jgi:LemA protein
MRAVLAVEPIDVSTEVNAIAIAAMVVAIAFFVIGWKSWRVSVRMADTPTVPPSAVPFGRAECTGRAALPEGQTPVGRTPAAWYRFQVQRYQNDSNNSASWHTHTQSSSTQRFVLVDDVGGVLVDPTGATIEGANSTARDLDVVTLRQLYAATGNTIGESRRNVDEPIGARSGRWRVLETSLPLGSKVTVFGPVLPHPANPATPVFRLDTARRGSQGELYIGRGTAAEVEARNNKVSALLVAMPLAAGAALGIWAVINGYQFIVGLALGATMYLPVALQWILDRYNRLVFTANQVEACWSMIDVALIRRATLVPQLVATVEAAFAHELVVQEALALARWNGGPRLSHEGTTATRAASTPVGSQLAALAERYPTLATSDNALELQRQLTDTEHRLASARSVYNHAVQLLLDRMGSFPDMIFAGRFRRRRSDYWQL